MDTTHGPATVATANRRPRPSPSAGTRPTCSPSWPAAKRRWSDAPDSDVNSTSGRTPGFLHSTRRSTHRDAGLSGPVLAGVGDFVWEDVDGDGIQDPDESGLAGVEVTLLDRRYAEISTTTTAADGSYGFTGQYPTEYSLRFLTPPGFAGSPIDQGTDDLLDSDASPSTRLTEVFTLSPGQHDGSRDAGMYQPVLISGIVWEDLNGDGVQQAVGNGVPDVAVHLLDAGLSLVATTITNIGGDYEFRDLVPGEYSLEFVVPPGALFSPQSQGGDDSLDSDVDPVTGRTAALVLTSGGSADRDAGFSGSVLAQVSGVAWDDVNGDGTQDVGESGLEGVTVALLDTCFLQIASTVTNADGSYGFTGLYPTEYSLRFLTPHGFVLTEMYQGTDDSLDSDADPSTGLTEVFALSPGQQDASRDAGLLRLVSIGGFVWEDVNQDGSRMTGRAAYPA